MIPIIPLDFDLQNFADIGHNFGQMFTPDEIAAGVDAYSKSGVNGGKFVKDAIKNRLLKKSKVGNSYGETLKITLGLEKYRYVMIQKIVPAPIPIYVCYYDSKRSNVYIPPIKIKQLSQSQLRRVKKNGMEYLAKKVRLTLPIPIEQLGHRVDSNSLIIVRDIAGERMWQKKPLQMNESVEDIQFVVMDYNA